MKLKINTKTYGGAFICCSKPGCNWNVTSALNDLSYDDILESSETTMEARSIANSPTTRQTRIKSGFPKLVAVENTLTVEGSANWGIVLGLFFIVIAGLFGIVVAFRVLARKQTKESRVR